MLIRDSSWQGIWLGEHLPEVQTGTEYRMLADAIMLGVILHQFTHWWEYARADDKRVVRFIVVCPFLPDYRTIVEGVVFLHDLQYWSYMLVSIHLHHREEADR